MNGSLVAHRVRVLVAITLAVAFVPATGADPSSPTTRTDPSGDVQRIVNGTWRGGAGGGFDIVDMVEVTASLAADTLRVHVRVVGELGAADASTPLDYTVTLDTEGSSEDDYHVTSMGGQALFHEDANDAWTAINATTEGSNLTFEIPRHLLAAVDRLELNAAAVLTIVGRDRGTTNYVDVVGVYPGYEHLANPLSDETPALGLTAVLFGLALAGGARRRWGPPRDF